MYSVSVPSWSVSAVNEKAWDPPHVAADVQHHLVRNIRLDNLIRRLRHFRQLRLRLVPNHPAHHMRQLRKTLQRTPDGPPMLVPDVRMEVLDHRLFTRLQVDPLLRPHEMHIAVTPNDPHPRRRRHVVLLLLPFAGAHHQVETARKPILHVVQLLRPEPHGKNRLPVNHQRTVPTHHRRFRESRKNHIKQ